MGGRVFLMISSFLVTHCSRQGPRGVGAFGGLSAGASADAALGLHLLGDALIPASLGTKPCSSCLPSPGGAPEPQARRPRQAPVRSGLTPVSAQSPARGCGCGDLAPSRLPLSFPAPLLQNPQALRRSDRVGGEWGPGPLQVVVMGPRPVDEVQGGRGRGRGHWCPSLCGVKTQAGRLGVCVRGRSRGGRPCPGRTGEPHPALPPTSSEALARPPQLQASVCSSVKWGPIPGLFADTRGHQRYFLLQEPCPGHSTLCPLRTWRRFTHSLIHSFIPHTLPEHRHPQL